MGCDIHSYAERKSADKYELITERLFDVGDFATPEPFSWRSYGTFAFLAGVRNYSDVTPISELRGWPADASVGAQEDYERWSGDAHSPSWLSVEELSAFDYGKQMEDRRVGRQIAPNLYSGACTANPGEGKAKTYREFLGEAFFRDLEILNEIGADRVVFFFDN